MSAIVSDDEIRSRDPRVERTRITFLDIKRRVIDREEDPHVVAGEYEVSMADLFRALAYYYDHREELEERERESVAARREGERRPRGLLERTASSDVEPNERAD